MEKIIVKRKTVIQSGIILDKVYINKKTFNHPYNKDFGLELGWNIDYIRKDKVSGVPGDCPPATKDGYYDRVGGNCVFFPY